MTAPGERSYYTAAAARRGLLQFVVGKVIAAALGIAFLTLSVRALQPASYGVYVTLLAGAELFYLVTGLGLSTIAQRYVAEYRIKALAVDFRAFLARQLRQRLLYSLLAIAVLLLAWAPLMRWSGLALAPDWMLVVALLMLGWAGVSFLEEVMGACLLQGYSQLLGVARNIGRLGVVVWGSQGMSTGLELRTLVWGEACVALGSWLAAEFLVRRWARKSPSGRGAQPGFHSPDMGPVARRFYLVQLAGQAYGSNITKMVLLRMAGAAQAASFGLAQSVSDMVRNYLPAQLLAGWVRPMMVARYVQSRDLSELSDILNLVFKINLLGLLPLAAGFWVCGDAMLAWFSGGRYTDLGALLCVMMFGLVLQTLHLLLSMVALTLESSRASLFATFSACLVLPLLLWLVWVLGPMGAALAMLVTESVWISMALRVLSRQGYSLRFDWLAWARVGLAALVAGGVVWTVGRGGYLQGWMPSMALLFMVFAPTVYFMRPCNARELHLVRQLLKRK